MNQALSDARREAGLLPPGLRSQRAAASRPSRLAILNALRFFQCMIKRFHSLLDWCRERLLAETRPAADDRPCGHQTGLSRAGQTLSSRHRDDARTEAP